MSALHRRELLFQGLNLIRRPDREKEIMQRRRNPLMDDPPRQLPNACTRGQYMDPCGERRTGRRHEGEIDYAVTRAAQHLI